MTYVGNALLKHEQVQHLGKISLYPYFLRFVIAGGCVSLGVYGLISDWLSSFVANCLFGVGYLFLFEVFIAWYSTELVITNKRVIVKVGFIKRNTYELYLARIEGVEVKQSILGRIFNFGSVYINGVGTEVAPVHRVSHPLEFRKAFFITADKYTNAVDKVKEYHEIVEASGGDGLM